MKSVYDKRGLPLQIGDVLKVFHFVGARRKKHYMYKHVIGSGIWKDGTHYLKVGHLDMTSDHYEYELDDTILKDVEIVQGITAFWDTERTKKALP